MGLDHLSGDGVLKGNGHLLILILSRVGPEGDHLFPNRIIDPDTRCLRPQKFDDVLGNGLKDLLLAEGRVNLDDRLDLADETIHITEENLFLNDLHHRGQFFEGEFAPLPDQSGQDGMNKVLINIEMVHKRSGVKRRLRNTPIIDYCLKVST